MAQTALRGNPVTTSGDLPAVGTSAPQFSLTGRDLAPVTSEDLSGQRVLLNIFPSLDTATCAAGVRAFNERAASLDNTTVVCVSADLPFAHGRFCSAEGIENVTTASTFKNPEFLDAFGVRMLDGPLAGLCVRSVVVYDTDGTVLYNELVPEISQEPDYDAAISSLS